LRLCSSRADVMTCSLTEISGHAGCYLVAKSDDTLKQMHHDSMLVDDGGPNRVSISFEEYVGTLDRTHSCYLVNIPQGACSCPDNKLLRMPCKHMFMIFKHTRYAFSDLPESLVSSPSMTVDTSVVEVSCPSAFAITT
jgi:hypothetical protein